MPASPSPLFPLARWTLLQRARSGSQEEARAALDTLCRAYWQPLYCVARQNGLGEHDAQDAVQGFFEGLLRRETFATAEASLGKLRQLLLTAFENYCAQQWRRATRQKRGGGAEHIEFTDLIDADLAGQRYQKACAGRASVEAVYNREWAAAVMERSLAALCGDYTQCGWQDRYEMLVGPLLQEQDDSTLAQTAARSGTTAVALRLTLHRMRGHYRDKIQRELAATLDSNDPRLIREEMAELFKAFA